MAFLIPDNLKSRSDVSPAIRRVANAFQVALDENVSVWYEPLYDPVGEKPHLVVLFPNWGIVVLEVLSTKEDRLLGVLRGRLRFERDGQEIEVENPILRAENLANLLKKRIEAEPRLEGMDIPISAGAVLYNLASDEAREKGVGKIISLNRCLFKPDIETAIAGSEGEAALLRAFTQMLENAPSERVPENLEKILRGLIQPEIVIDKIGKRTQDVQLTIFRPPESADDVIRVMDKHQEAMAKSLGEGHRIIRGVAGSGKTLILVYRAKLFAQAFPQHRYLVTCYTRALAGQIRALLKDYKNIDVIHLDMLMWKTIKQAGLRHPGYQKDDSGEEVARVALQALARGAGPRYRAVLLDEAQDFCTDALKFTLGLIQKGQDDLIIVADAAQNIFRRKFSWRQAGIQAQGRTRILRVNYRNTKEILEFASKFLLASKTLQSDEVPDFEDENVVIPPESAARNGPKPELFLVADTNEEIRQSISQAKSWAGPKGKPRNLAILYTSTADGNIERARSLYDGLRKAGISPFWLNDPNDKNARDKIADSHEPVILSTVHSSKGLEFPRVIICGISREGLELEDNRKLVYVGMTRAMDRLAVICRQNHPLAEDLKLAVA